jgi:hypothetical protein
MMKAALTTAILLAALAGLSAGQDKPSPDAVLTPEFLAGVFDGDRTNAGRAEKLSDAAADLKGDKKVKIALFKKAVEYGLKGMATDKGRRTTLYAINQLSMLTDTDPNDNYDKIKRVELYRVWYGRYARGLHVKRSIRGHYIDALVDAAKMYEQTRKWPEAIRTYTDAVRLSSRPSTLDLPKLQNKLKRVTHMRKTQKQIDLSVRLLKIKPDNAKARMTIVKLYIIEMDDPARANTYLSADVDETWRTYIPLATARPFEIKPSAWRELASWYGKVLAPMASKFAKPHILRKALAYCGLFLASKDRDTRGAILLGSLKTKLLKELDDLGIEPPTPPKPESLAGGKLTLKLGKGVSLNLRGIPPKRVDPVDEMKGKSVAANPFYIGVTEVTQQQYETVMGENPSAYKGPKNPVEQVSWIKAREFCRKVAKLSGRTVRLPTDAEWRHARSAATKSEYFFGDKEQLGDYAWYKANTKDRGAKHDHHRPVAGKKPNQWGLYDMDGNVWEWVFDLHEPKSGDNPETSKGQRRACGDHWGGPCSPYAFGWGDADAGYKTWGFRIVVQYE